MKSKFVKLVIACLVCLWLGSGLVGNSYASDLEFSQVLTYGRNTTGTDTYTVPAGKVWHVTYIHTGYYTTNQWGYVTIDGVYVKGAPTGHATNAPGPDGTTGLWLEAGTQLALTVAGTVTTYSHVFVSIIEYTVQ